MPVAIVPYSNFCIDLSDAKWIVALDYINGDLVSDTEWGQPEDISGYGSGHYLGLYPGGVVIIGPLYEIEPEEAFYITDIPLYKWSNVHPFNNINRGAFVLCMDENIYLALVLYNFS